MLPARNRLTSATDFRRVVRRGRRKGSPRLVVHLHQSSSEAAPVVGLVVSRAVGGAVVRNQVARRLRHQVRDRVARMPAGVLLVVRALPPAAGCSSTRLGEDLDAALDSLLGSVLAPGLQHAAATGASA